MRLKFIDIPEEQRLESGVSASAVMTLIDEVKAAATEVRVPADLLETLLMTMPPSPR